MNNSNSHRLVHRTRKTWGGGQVIRSAWCSGCPWRPSPGSPEPIESQFYRHLYALTPKRATRDPASDAERST